MDYAIGYVIGVAIMLYPIFLFFRMGYRDMKKHKDNRNLGKWKRDTLASIGLFENDSYNSYKFEKIIFCADGSYSSMVYTIDKKLYFFDTSKFFTEIKLESIMDIKVDITVNTKNVKRLVALTSTYDTNSTSFSHLTIITEGRNYVVNYLSDENEVNRFKLILEKEIKELNSVNN